MVSAVANDEPTMPAPAPAGADQSPAPVTTLRGASVGRVDAGRVGQVLAGLGLAILAALVVVLFLSGLHKNAQISNLRQHGVVVDLKVTTCVGLIGGSGSNGAGYSCRGTFTVDGHRYNEAIPGTAFHAVGQNLRVVTVPGDPALLSPVHTVAREHTSWSVYIVPAVLLLALLLLIAFLIYRQRRVHPAER
jgi:uncharacterized integral membrane protein